MKAYGAVDLRVLGDYDWRLSRGNVWKVERLLFEIPHRPIAYSQRARRSRCAEGTSRSSGAAPGRKPVYYDRRTLDADAETGGAGFDFADRAVDRPDAARAAASVEIEVPLRLRDRFFLRLLQRLFEPPRQRVAARPLRLHGLLEQRLAPRLRVRQDPVRLVQLRLVGALGLDVTDDAPEALVDHQRGLAARADGLRISVRERHSSPIMLACRRPHGSICASPPTTSIARAAWIGAPGPTRIAAVLATIDADIVALQEVIGPGLDGAGHAEEIGAALGMGWVMAPTRELRRHQFGNAVLSRFPIREHTQHDLTGRPASRGAASASRSTSAATGCCRSTTCTSARRCSSAATRRRASRLGPRPPRVRRRRSCSATSTNGRAGPRRRRRSRDRLKSVDLYRHLRRRRTYPGFFPLLHLDHIYFAGDIEVRKIELPRTRLALVASDHLPLVADIRVRF